MANAFDKVCRNLLNILEQAAKFDSWGQRLEASETYHRFCEECTEASMNALEEDEKKILQTVINHAKIRGDILQGPAVVGKPDEVNHQQIGADIETLQGIIFKSRRRKSVKRKTSSAVMKAITDGGLLPPVRPQQPGYSYVTVKINKIGLKDALTYMDPFVTISLKDETGKDISPAQNTPAAELYEEKYIIFNEDVHIQKAVDEIQPNMAIFFEFQHFKTKKNKISTKCFAFLECDEIKEGPLALELYQKPVDYARKKLFLLTEKKLFLHVNLLLQKA